MGEFNELTIDSADLANALARQSIVTGPALKRLEEQVNYWLDRWKYYSEPMTYENLERIHRTIKDLLKEEP